MLVYKQLIEDELEQIAPPFLTQHSVLPSSWNYLPQARGHSHNMLFLNLPPYHSVTSIDIVSDQNQCDNNMNNTLANNNNHKITTNGIDEFGFDIHSVMTMEILENTKGKPINGLIETRNEEVLRRVAEMQKMVENSEKYLNEQGELVHESEIKPNTRLPWHTIDFDSDCDSMSSSKQSSNEDAPAPGVLKHSDSLVLLAESINFDLNGITKGLNLIGANGFESNMAKNAQDNSPKPQRKVQGLSQLLSDLHAISNDLSQSESDSESIHTPTSSPIHRTQMDRNPKKVFRTSFGLHSPDSSTLGNESKDTNLREYLKLLKEASSKDSTDIDLAAKKLSELYGFEIGDDTFVESDPDVIDLTSIPPPQTPDELDSLNVLNAAPIGFGSDRTIQQDNGDLEKFLAQVAVEPPTQKITPAKELTPEEIMSYIIPPPPGLSDDELENDNPISKMKKDRKFNEESLYVNSSRNGSSHGNPTTVCGKTIEYATVDRKGAFSCCSKNKRDDEIATSSSSAISNQSNKAILELPPRKCEHKEKPIPPARPPKNSDLQMKPLSPTKTTASLTNTFRLNGGGNGIYYDTTPQKTFISTFKPNTVIASGTLPTRKSNLPPVPVKPIFRTPIPLPKLINSDSRIAGIVSPRFQRYQEPKQQSTFSNGNSNGFINSPIPVPRLTNGFRSNSIDCSNNPKGMENKQISLSALCSPQMSRKLNTELIIKCTSPNSVNGSPILESRNGHVINVASLMQKTDVAMSGLLVKLDHIAAQCTQSQAAGGGISIDEEKFQKARNELTDKALELVKSSKQLTAAMSDITPTTLPEHLSVSLTALRRITELAQDMTKHTSSPLQTRNIVLKVHDVASSFRELSNVQLGPIGSGALALQAECLSNVLTALIRSLRVFSP